MQYKTLGRTGLKVSAVGLGCGNFGGVGSLPALFGKGENEAEAFALMDAAFELGINLFDTANSYGGGRSETYIGKWLQARGPRVRAQLIISSKLFNPMDDGPNDFGLSRRHIMQQVEQSLRRLQCDYLDLYLSHEPDPATPLEETLRAFDDLVRQGKVRYLGAANIRAWQLVRALWLSDKHGWVRIDWVQNQYNLLVRDDERELLPLCADQQLGYTPFSPLAGGWLAGIYRAGEAYPEGSRMTLRPEPYAAFVNARIFDALARFEAHAVERGVEMAVLALAWVMAHPLVTAPLVGPRFPAQLDTVRSALAIRLSADERDAITKIFTEVQT